MHTVIHKQHKRKKKAPKYPTCVLKDAKIRNDEGPTRDYMGVWHYTCWEWYQEQQRNAKSDDAETRQAAFNELRWAKKRMAGWQPKRSERSDTRATD